MHIEFRVFFNDGFVGIWAYQIGVFFRDLVFGNKLSTHVRGPEICWGLTSAAKSFLQLRRVEHFGESFRSTICCKYNLEFSLVIDEHLYTFVEESLTPAYVSIETSEQKVHQISLAQIAKCKDLFSRQ